MEAAAAATAAAAQSTPAENEQAEAGELNRMRRRIGSSAEHRQHCRPLPIGRGATRAAPALGQEEAQAGGQQQRRASATAAGERVRILILRRIIKEAQTGN